jgi:hypothetical protein
MRVSGVWRVKYLAAFPVVAAMGRLRAINALAIEPGH